ncbi:hypothetical protein N801_01090 [Knoellia aerolata DSM 18566]|uniref:Uncharacterized protein n=1 Tax=Knoellia aerolata DSM 18566 TaxID=1385519 RepID=A0A0A0JN86_9MICO|nr:hypothetical protein N801_01090 [Knoellia aerolata DSM 18566]
MDALSVMKDSWSFSVDGGSATAPLIRHLHTLRLRPLMNDVDFLNV